ncbi:ORF9R [Ictalurid herpesvirus 1]|nr:ORF9L [Ictalurid herpesvirus 1]QAB08570.1 ORF9R [Ictalurid herpesvirus 1]
MATRPKVRRPDRALYVPPKVNRIKRVIFACGHRKRCEIGYRPLGDSGNCGPCGARRDVFAPDLYGSGPLPPCPVCGRAVVEPTVREACGHVTCNACETEACAVDRLCIGGRRLVAICDPYPPHPGPRWRGPRPTHPETHEAVHRSRGSSEDACTYAP